MTEVAVNEPFGNSDQSSISFKIVMDKNKAASQIKILNWAKANFDDIR